MAIDGGSTSVAPTPGPSYTTSGAPLTSGSPIRSDDNPTTRSSIPTLNVPISGPESQSSSRGDPFYSQTLPGKVYSLEQNPKPPTAGTDDQSVHVSLSSDTPTLKSAADGRLPSTSPDSAFRPVPASRGLITLAGQTYTVTPAGFTIAHTTLLPNGPAVTVAGTIVSLNPSALIIGTSTLDLQTSFEPAPMTWAGQVFTPNPTGFILADKTILPNDPAITMSGIQISLNPSALIIGTSSMFFTDPVLPSGTTTTSARQPSDIATQVQPAALPTSGTIITVDKQTSIVATDGFQVNGLTLLPGSPAIRVSGTLYGSLDAKGTALVIGTGTISVAKTTAVDLGGLIMSGFGPIGQHSATTTTITADGNETAVEFHGEGIRRRCCGGTKMRLLLISVVLAAAF